MTKRQSGRAKRYIEKDIKRLKEEFGFEEEEWRV
jgi:hypothetical protein